LGGALSGRDTTGVQKTVSGLIKLVSPNPEIPVSDDVLEWASRIALECRRRVKEQQKRIGSAEFRNTQFSYAMGDDGVGKFVATPELYSESSNSSDPLPPGQAWVIAPGSGDENPGLYQVNINEGPGSGVKILNQPAPPAFQGKCQVLPSRTSMSARRNSSATATLASTSSRSISSARIDLPCSQHGLAALGAESRLWGHYMPVDTPGAVIHGVSGGIENGERC